MNETTTTEKIELVEATVKIPKQVLEFYLALHLFKRSPEPFEEFLGYPIIVQLSADFDSALEPCINVEKIAKRYGLSKLPEFEHPPFKASQ
jgi:hypothetical protein